MVTKYAKWVALPCGKCRWLQDIGTIVEHDMDPTCELHKPFVCADCGDTTDGSVPLHGRLGGGFHKPVRAND